MWITFSSFPKPQKSYTKAARVIGILGIKKFLLSKLVFYPIWPLFFFFLKKPLKWLLFFLDLWCCYNTHTICIINIDDAQRLITCLFDNTHRLLTCLFDHVYDICIICHISIFNSLKIFVIDYKRKPYNSNKTILHKIKNTKIYKKYRNILIPYFRPIIRFPT